MPLFYKATSKTPARKFLFYSDRCIPTNYFYFGDPNTRISSQVCFDLDLRSKRTLLNSMSLFDLIAISKTPVSFYLNAYMHTKADNLILWYLSKDQRLPSWMLRSNLRSFTLKWKFEVTIRLSVLKKLCM